MYSNTSSIVLFVSLKNSENPVFRVSEASLTDVSAVMYASVTVVFVAS